jgi:tRNA modification GTPase
MLPDPQDTIVALATAPGPGGRAIVRLSGQSAVRIVRAVFESAEAPASDRRQCYPGQCHLLGVAAPLPADLYVWPAPRTYTGQEMAELHTLSCPPLLEVLIGQLLAGGARAAQPGEFTLRAFLAGKRDLTRAEAVLAVIEAGSREELRHALTQLAGGVTRPLQELRSDLLDLLADVEAALDFAEEEVQFVSQDELLKRLSKGLALVTLLGKQLDQRSVGHRPFRVVLAGRPNVGKSSLFNALGGGNALVSPQPGTTRDYLVRTLDLAGARVDLVDTAGWQRGNGTVHEQAQALGREQAEQADLVLLCVEAGREITAAEDQFLSQKSPPAIGVATKCDLTAPALGLVATSAVTRLGLDTLRTLLVERARAQARPALAPSLSRCRHHVTASLECLRRAHQTVLFEDPPEILALELRSALDQLGEMVGAVYTDDLLDRIFSRFCIGK